MDGWGDQRIGDRCEYPSFLSRDGFPMEMSVSWRQGRPEVRILFESLGSSPSALAAQEAGRRLTRRLADLPGVDISRYLLVEGLFLTTTPSMYRPTVWHSLAWTPGQPPRYKAYLNPQVRGADRAHDVVCEAMGLLGLGRAWKGVADRQVHLVKRGHELEFFALDLTEGEDARVKIYYRHNYVPRAELDEVARLARRHDAALAGQIYDIVYPDIDSVVLNEPMTCLAFRTGLDEPDEANVYLRLPDAADSDADATDRLATALDMQGVDPGPWRAVIDGLTPGVDLDEWAGLQELLAVRTHGADQPADLGVYLRFAVYDKPASVSRTC
jgi:DMATS type aromatic prenyltransferase